MSRQERHERHQPEAVGPERHDDPVEQHDLPQRRYKGARDEADDKQNAADQQQPARPEPIDQHADQRRADPADQLRHRIGDRGLGPAPAELLDEGDEIHRIGVHQRGADREGGKRAAQHQPGGSHFRIRGERAGNAHRRQSAGLPRIGATANSATVYCAAIARRRRRCRRFYRPPLDGTRRRPVRPRRRRQADPARLLARSQRPLAGAADDARHRHAADARPETRPSRRHRPRASDRAQSSPRKSCRRSAARKAVARLALNHASSTTTRGELDACYRSLSRSPPAAGRSRTRGLRPRCADRQARCGGIVGAVRRRLRRGRRADDHGISGHRRRSGAVSAAARDRAHGGRLRQARPAGGRGAQHPDLQRARLRHDRGRRPCDRAGADPAARHPAAPRIAAARTRRRRSARSSIR